MFSFLKNKKRKKKLFRTSFLLDFFLFIQLGCSFAPENPLMSLMCHFSMKPEGSADVLHAVRIMQYNSQKDSVAEDSVSPSPGTFVSRL